MMLDVKSFQLQSFLPLPYEEVLAPRLKRAHEKLQSGSGAGGEFTGWVHLPRDYDREEFARIQAAAERIRSDSQALVVIGIGGSYLGARAVIDLLRSPYYNLKKKDTPDIFFTGNGLSTDALLEVKSGAADAAVMDFVLANTLVGTGDYSDLMVIPDLELSVEEYGIGFRQGSDLTAAVNQAMQELIDDGTLNELAVKYELADLLLANQ